MLDHHGWRKDLHQDISKKKTLFHLYLAKVLPKVKKES